MNIEIRGEELILDKERAIFLPKEELLAISDLHLGKAAHFRKAGLAIPTTVSRSDINRLEVLLHKYNPKTLLINGDMFHSDHNSEIEEFAKWRKGFKEINFVLVKGNHDKQKQEIYANMNVDVYDPTYNTSNFCFIHDSLKCNSELYSIGGHIHPGVSVYNKAKQRLRFPCFYFGEAYAVLPAFSNFTGLQIVKPKEKELIFAITPTKVVRV